METGASRQFTTRNGLSSNIIYAVYEDAHGKLWLPGNYGLMQFDKNNYQVNTWLASDGISHNEFNTGSHYQATDGTLYFGGLSGVTAFHPGDFTEEASAPVTFRMTSCQTLNNRTGALEDRSTEVFNTGQLVLQPSSKSFIIEFALLNYENVHRNSYSYKIEGLDKQWHHLRENSLRVNALPYGNYVLYIRGQSVKGQQSELTIPVFVIKPFYLKNSFILTSIFFMLLSIYGSFRWRLQNLKQAKIRLQKTVTRRTQEIRQQKDQIEKDKDTIEKQTVKLRELDKLKSRFFVNISHELRTPLTLISGSIEKVLSKNRETITEEGLSDLSVSKQNTRRLLTLTEEILDLSRLEAGQLKVRTKPVVFYPLISRLSDAYHSFIKQKDLRFSLVFQLPKDRVLTIDKNKFDKIINNLLSNAAKFTDPGGSIQMTITASEASDSEASSYFQVEVSDTGRGIHPDELPRVFDRFYQSEQPDALVEGGSGIGLALAKELAELMNGTLRAESQQGKGSRFIFCFPAKINRQDASIFHVNKIVQEVAGIERSSNAEIAVDKNKSKKGSEQKPTILLVEDHPEMRTFIRQILESHYQVSEAIDGVQALEVLRKRKVDLVISDVMMPRMDGFGLLEQVRKKEALQKVPFMMLTARAADTDKMRAFDIGVDDYLTKPFQTSELIARTRNLIKNYQHRKLWATKTDESPEEESTPAFDREFARQVETLVKKEIANTHFGVIDMAEVLLVSQRQLTRKVRRSTGLSPLQFIREVRLQEARRILENREKETVTEVMYAVDFSSKSYFSQSYQRRFGKLPSAYKASS